MNLGKELGFRRESIRVRENESLLNIYYTGDILRKKARVFFRAYGITDVQYNVLVLLHYEADDNRGLAQQDLSRMMLVNRSNITSLIDRMEKAKLVRRFSVPGDRRYNEIRITPLGKEVLLKVEGRYMEEVKRIMGVLSEDESESLIRALERIREGLREG
jgi:DNA-binding MarR family transcriptional regulator